MSERRGCPANCPDRRAEPNCHMTCEKYRDMVAEQKKLRAEKRSEAKAYRKEMFRKWEDWSLRRKGKK